MTPAIIDLYTQHIQPLPPEERLELLALISQGLPAAEGSEGQSLEELRGLGKEIWAGVDAQEYVEGLRGEWEKTP